MQILVIGASSQIGHFLLPRLVAAGEDVLPLGRHPGALHPDWLAGRLPDEMPALPPLKAIVCLGPLNGLSRWLSQTRVSGTPHIVATSSMSAETKRDSTDPEERDLSRILREAETQLSTTCASRGMPWTIFRPTLIYGAGLDKSLTPVVQGALRRHVFPLPAGRGQRQPVHADDIAAAIVAALQRPAGRNQTFAIGGGERLSAAEMFRRARRTAGSATLPVPIPRFILNAAVLVSPGMRGPVRRLDSDLIADNRLLEAALDVHPRAFAPQPETWRTAS
ncbi:MAG TPA: NAD-dependent epimerase/dehydratase family protein [Luteibacter sp.]|uniref:SDR family oxidoreductase n=1 Tax=Luteibacter sp. TaxID=1886636 RepID=UPI002C3CE867|nr:NAD-dependent epimerase/dehydratase family protein [Luteibacter sp.]HVI55352.1 NAD-dependent epimerase/dehydratase family protein [Luteibacter sp.]